MKSVIIALCLVACVFASDDEAKVIQSSYEQTPEGGFQYGYETDNGIQGHASGVVKHLDKDVVALEVSGSNQYKSPEGDVIQVTFIANENGYQPQGAHLPTPPAPVPIPDYIVRAIEYIAAHPYTEKQ